MLKFKSLDEACLWLSDSYKEGGWEVLANRLLASESISIEATKKAPIKELVNLFSEAYKKAYGFAYVCTYAKDGAAFKRLWQSLAVDGYDPMPDIARVIDYFFSPEHEYTGNADICFFVSRYNRLQVAAFKNQNKTEEWGDV